MQESRDRDLWQMWTASLTLGMTNPNNELETLKGAAILEEVEIIEEMVENLPLSVRPMVIEVAKTATIRKGGSWDAIIEQYDEDSPQYRFYMAGKLASKRNAEAARDAMKQVGLGSQDVDEAEQG